jgi:hypothetical protein
MKWLLAAGVAATVDPLCGLISTAVSRVGLPDPLVHVIIPGDGRVAQQGLHCDSMSVRIVQAVDQETSLQNPDLLFALNASPLGCGLRRTMLKVLTQRIPFVLTTADVDEATVAAEYLTARRAREWFSEEAVRACSGGSIASEVPAYDLPLDSPGAQLLWPPEATSGQGDVFWLAIQAGSGESSPRPLARWLYGDASPALERGS